MGRFQKTTCIVEKLILLRARAGSSYKFKKNQKVKNRTIWTTFGSKFRVFFTGLGLSEGCRRPNRAAATPIGQQNQPGHLKLSVLDGKTGKYTDFDFAKIKPNILVPNL